MMEDLTKRIRYSRYQKYLQDILDKEFNIYRGIVFGPIHVLYSDPGRCWLEFDTYLTFLICLLGDMKSNEYAPKTIHYLIFKRHFPFLPTHMFLALNAKLLYLSMTIRDVDV